MLGITAQIGIIESPPVSLNSLQCKQIARWILLCLTGVLGFQRLRRNLGKAPSVCAKSAGYAFNQSDPATSIYDGRRAPRDGHDTTAPPIHIYHDVFSGFYDHLTEAPSQITADFLRKTQDFMTKAAVVCTSEEDRRKLTWECLSELLDLSLSCERNSDGSLPDGTYILPFKGVRACLAVIEVKREMAEGGSDPTNQVSISFKKICIADEVSPTHNCHPHLNFPTTENQLAQCL